MNPASKSFQFGLLLCSVAMFGGAALLWSGKVQRDVWQQGQVENSPSSERRAADELLRKSYRANNELSYSALSTTVAFVGDKCLRSTAQITRAPDHLSVKMISGPMAGAQSGYSERWFWRQGAGEELEPYAELAPGTSQMASHRFALLTRNYTATLIGHETLNGRLADIVELRPHTTIDGAKGPARRLFIDQESKLTLRIDSFNCELKPVMQSSLSKLELGSPLKEVSFEPPAVIAASLKKTEWRGEELGEDAVAAARKTGFQPPRPTVLPAGFEFDGYGVHRCHTTGILQLAAFTRYTDGLNALTVFAFKPVNANIAKNMRGMCNFGPGTMSSREVNGGRLVALADLPTKTLNRVLASANFETVKSN